MLGIHASVSVLLAITGTLLLAATAARGESGLGTAEAVVACVEENVPQGDDLRSITLVTRDRMGAERVTHADVYGRRTAEDYRHLVVRFRQPPDLVGSVLYLEEAELGMKTWIRTPDMGLKEMVQGGEGQSNLFGTGMSYEDFARLLGFVRAESENQQLQGDDIFDERPVYVLESYPEPGTSAYARVVTSVDKKTCVPLQIKLYERVGALPRKIISADAEDIFPVGDIWIAHKMDLRDYRDGKRSTLHVRSVFPPPPTPLPAWIFDRDQLQKEPRIVIGFPEPTDELQPVGGP